MSAAAVDALVLRAERMRWLAPDAAMDALGEEARAWVHDRADEHLAALAPFAEGAAFEARVSFTRELAEAARRWDDAWAPAPRTPYLLALTRAKEAIWETADGDVEAPDRAAWRVMDALPPPDLWNSLLGHGAYDTLPGVECAGSHASWLVHHDAGTSPWGPLFALWERGLWPLALPDGELLVYVPIVAYGRLLPSAASPQHTPPLVPIPSTFPPSQAPDPVPVRRPRAALPLSVFPNLRDLGCGPGPGRDRPLPPRAPPLPPGPQMPLAGAPMPVTPYPVPLPSGAVAQVSPVPVTPTKPEPWYKRIFR